MSKPIVVRLSYYVCFVRYKDYVELQHTARNMCYQIDLETFHRLLYFGNFKAFEEDLNFWFDNGILVAPYLDTFELHKGKKESEAGLANAYHKWYWQHEVETEREYRWLGKVAVKMPTDLFFYQETLSELSRRHVLELGYGQGGSLHFFSSIVGLLGGGLVVGVDKENSASVIDASSDLPVILIHGDALCNETVYKAQIISQNYDLIVLDLGPSHINYQALTLWTPLLAPQGVLVIEDLWGTDDENLIPRTIDLLLLDNPQLAFYEPARRYPFLKGIVLSNLG
ncbi:CmcI family methyltransferase [Methylovulum psychrotolerans]|uniref:Rhamnosyl O-methyltransferase n=1 Tax=Methylovulum psychrotolerans TaxID=1704499 RepID=A0A2S5CGP6_9GAMM|nr:CmcI family methyltransferase [Methylovulum psychrotolerans]POZ49981.1 Rhamnosyl O-methyltransferase [Methylovulum psychrotolerans]